MILCYYNIASLYYVLYTLYSLYNKQRSISINVSEIDDTFIESRIVFRPLPLLLSYLLTLINPFYFEIKRITIKNGVYLLIPAAIRTYIVPT